MENPTLPLEMMREILLRLPVRSVLRFKCVCKTWFSLISEPHFGISHYQLDAAPSYRFLLPFFGPYFESVDADPHLAQHFSAVHLPIPPFRYMYERTRKQILGSCRGLILFYYHVGQFIDLILGNPSTGIYKGFPNFGIPNSFLKDITSRFLYGFGYDASTEDYLLILIPCPLYIYPDGEPRKTHVFSFKTHSWNLYDTNVLYWDMGIQFRSGSLLNGALHWNPYSGMNEIWVMKEYKVQSSWTKLIRIPIRYPLRITKDGGIFGISEISRGSLRLAKFNDKGELVDSFVCNGDHVWYDLKYSSGLNKESLLSLPTVIGE
ncbi:hypothetical protein Fmac_017358 [Flemingia macrophylla]|uniref:F-box domain-containing protein n=1 Tax=Flemingia macrophylla TaxID=520843 RepID=A0ABD1M2B2_9FABA